MNKRVGQRPYFVYILECEDGSLYTGITTDVERRFLEHKSGIGAHFTRAKKAKCIVYTEESPDRSSASKREAEIKKWPREKKLAFITNALPTASTVERELKSLGTTVRARNCEWFFKTGKGQYGEGDVFIGVTVPEQRKVAKKYRGLALGEVEKLLEHKTHECRLTALLILVDQYKRGDEKTHEKIAKFYLKHAKRVNNWDLVDTSAPNILGTYLLKRDRRVLYKLAKSKNLWERRIAIVATFAFISNRESADTFAIVEILLTDTHDLIHKATGWMLREVGKRVSLPALTTFLNKHKAQMPRTALRYAIEHFPPEIRKAFLASVRMPA
ncbi:MAG: DNA alkylation repair protein [Minisyncoccia bacterium]